MAGLVRAVAVFADDHLRGLLKARVALGIHAAPHLAPRRLVPAAPPSRARNLSRHLRAAGVERHIKLVHRS